MSDIPALLQPLKDRLARRDALVERGEHRRRQSRCADPERTESQHYQHPANVTWETVPHPSYVSHLEALSDRVPQLIATIEAVAGMHVMEFIEDGEDSRNRCMECLYEQTDDEQCPTVVALTQALGGDTA